MATTGRAHSRLCGAATSSQYGVKSVGSPTVSDHQADAAEPPSVAAVTADWASGTRRRASQEPP
ncbi:hypothetical protein [Streptomyces sp. NPDC086787]|uniref:hypothetical protein n=1 Tax=Streptomyces sp. NPDC086787 TaxID=3365759 RepID=UPI00382CB9C5